VSSLTLPGPFCLPFARQDAVARLDQLAVSGISASDVADQIAWGRWQLVGRTVVVAHNGPLTLGQQEWACVLGASRPAALCGRTAAKRCGLDGWDDGESTCWSHGEALLHVSHCRLRFTSPVATYPRETHIPRVCHR
jgi:hypothetical protein